MRNMLIVVWILCGLYSWGTLMANFNYCDRTTWARLQQTSRDNAGICGFVALTGPFGIIPALVFSNINQHGWELWGKRGDK